MVGSSSSLPGPSSAIPYTADPVKEKKTGLRGLFTTIKSAREWNSPKSSNDSLHRVAMAPERMSGRSPLANKNQDSESRPSVCDSDLSRRTIVSTTNHKQSRSIDFNSLCDNMGSQASLGRPSKISQANASSAELRTGNEDFKKSDKFVTGSETKLNLEDSESADQLGGQMAPLSPESQRAMLHRKKQ